MRYMQRRCPNQVNVPIDATEIGEIQLILWLPRRIVRIVGIISPHRDDVLFASA